MKFVLYTLGAGILALSIAFVYILSFLVCPILVLLQKHK